MNSQCLSTDDASRLLELHALGILDTPSEERFDRITRLAKRLFGVSIAAISLVDESRLWFKSSVGLSVAETTREHAFCSYVVFNENLMEVPDATLDERFRETHWSRSRRVCASMPVAPCEAPAERSSARYASSTPRPATSAQKTVTCSPT